MHSLEPRPYAGAVREPAESQPADSRPATPPSLPRAWRIPPWQPAALILLGTVLIALDLYAHISTAAKATAALIALAALVAAGCAARFLLVADDDGIWVRRLFGERLVEWSEVAKVETVVLHRNAMTVRITRIDGSHLDVPPSLVQPALPTGMRKAQKAIGVVATELAEVAKHQKHR
jgi:hypothetical protein